jgi:hypothetical protein
MNEFERSHMGEDLEEAMIKNVLLSILYLRWVYAS